jgi:hypothetical protein
MKKEFNYKVYGRNEFIESHFRYYCPDIYGLLDYNSNNCMSGLSCKGCWGYATRLIKFKED